MKVKIGDNVLVRSGRPMPGQENARYPISRPDTPAVVVGFRRFDARDDGVLVEFEGGRRGFFRPLDVSKPRTA
jgi:hypothetical protein